MRASGVLMHISSLPSKYGIGTMGEEAYKFVDFLAEAKQTYWQILPICPTSYGDSPYQSFSTHAGNPYFIDLDMLEEDGLLENQNIRTRNGEKTKKKLTILLYMRVDLKSLERHMKISKKLIAQDLIFFLKKMRHGYRIMLCSCL